MIILLIAIELQSKKKSIEKSWISGKKNPGWSDPGL